MASRRCSDCGISYPPDHAMRCDVCREELAYLANDQTDSDWQEKVALARTTSPQLEEHDRIGSWRLYQLLEAGYQLTEAEKLAAGEVDLHQAVELRRRGCEGETALRILL